MSLTEELLGFAHGVAAMRQAQELYSKNRTHENLKAAKKLESQVDKVIVEVLSDYEDGQCRLEFQRYISGAATS